MRASSDAHRRSAPNRGLALLLACLATTAVVAQDRREQAWKKIAPYFTPPPEYADKLGDYRSPLLFEDGSKVKAPEDWERRRQELLKTWHDLLGPWPEIMEDQQLEIVDSKRREDFTQHAVHLKYSPLHPTEGYLLVPDGDGPHPAVVVVYYEPESAIGLGRDDRDFALQLTRRGFVTLSVGMTEATASRTYGLFYPSIDDAVMQPLSGLAYGAANAYHALANRPEVDPERIGITGHSYGGKWSMFASCLYDKWACAAWSDGGIVMQDDRSSINYWEPWYLGYQPGKKWRKRGMPTEDNPVDGIYPKLRQTGRNLHELHALMAPRPFLVSGGSEDPVSRWEVLNHTVAVNELLGYENRIAMTNRPDHSPNAESNEIMYAFFEYFLRPGQ